MAAKDIWSKITPDDQKWLNGIGKSLLISGKKLVDGLKDGEIASMLECKLDVDSVLLETTWSMSESTILATHKKDDGNILEPSSKKVKELRAAFEKNRTQLLDTDTSLQSLRLRYRIADIKENTITDFKLGLAGLGTAANFSLKTIEQVGIDGIVDLAVVWLNKDLKDAAKMGITGLDKDDDLEGNSRVVSHDKAFPKNQIGKNYSYGKYKEFDIDDQGQFINKDVYIQKFEAEYEEWGNDNKYASEQAVPPTTLICQ